MSAHLRSCSARHEVVGMHCGHFCRWSPLSGGGQTILRRKDSHQEDLKQIKDLFLRRRQAISAILPVRRADSASKQGLTETCRAKRRHRGNPLGSPWPARRLLGPHHVEDLATNGGVDFQKSSLQCRQSRTHHLAGQLTSHMCAKDLFHCTFDLNEQCAPNAARQAWVGTYV